MNKCEECIHINVCRKMTKWTPKANDCGDFVNSRELFSINNLEEMQEIMYDSGGNMTGYGVLMKDIRYVVKVRENKKERQ